MSPRAAERIAREAATRPFDQAARSINTDWRTGYDGKQIQRISEAIGATLVRRRLVEMEACERGDHRDRPPGPANAPALLVVEMDGGRVQGREKNPESGSRWREDKVLTVTSYLPGVPGASGASGASGGGEGREPVKLVTTHLATMAGADLFGRLARVEAERRGIRQADQTIEIGDGAAWIDTQHQKHFFRCPRIIDYYHAAEHLHASAKAACGEDAAAADALAGRMKTDLWEGRVGQVVATLRERAAGLGPPRDDDPPQHPRRVLARDVGYFERHEGHMDYPACRAKGWPIGSGVVEAGVKQVGKRLKGSEQFWSEEGAEAILALRAMWLSEDARWDHYWLCGQPRGQAA